MSADPLDFCGCVSARTGSFIVGYFKLVGEIIGVLYLLVLTILLGKDVSDYHQDMDFLGLGHAIGVILLSCAAVILTVLAGMLALTISLLIGLHKNKRGLVKLFLIGSSVFITVFTALFIYSFFENVDTVVTICCLLGLLLQYYYFLVVGSYFLKMEDTEGVVYTLTL